MTEILSTRANHLVDPFVHVWGWRSPSTCSWRLGGRRDDPRRLLPLARRHTRRTCTCFVLPLIAIVVLSLGMVLSSWTSSTSSTHGACT